MPFDAGGKRGEAAGSSREVGVHGLQGVHGGTFDNVEDGVAQKRGAEELSTCDFGDNGAAQGMAEEEDVGEFWPGEVGRRGSNDEV